MLDSRCLHFCGHERSLFRARQIGGNFYAAIRPRPASVNSIVPGCGHDALPGTDRPRIRRAGNDDGRTCSVRRAVKDGSGADDYRHDKSRLHPDRGPGHVGSGPRHPEVSVEGGRRRHRRRDRRHLQTGRSAGRQGPHRHRHRNEGRLHHRLEDLRPHRSHRRRLARAGPGADDHRHDKSRLHTDRGPGHMGAGTRQPEVSVEGQRRRHRRSDRRSPTNWPQRRPARPSPSPSPERRPATPPPRRLRPAQQQSRPRDPASMCPGRSAANPCLRARASRSSV